MVLEAIERFRETRTSLRAKGRAPAPAREENLRCKITQEVREEMRKKVSLELGDGTSGPKEAYEASPSVCTGTNHEKAGLFCDGVASWLPFSALAAQLARKRF